MRTIKFRGKSLENGEWLYGDLIHYEWEPEQPYPYIQTGMERNEHGIMQTRGGRVDPSTIGQYTGLTDKDGKEIYEGDIVKIGPFPEMSTWVASLEWSNKYSKFFLREKSDRREYPDNADLGFMLNEGSLVIGNIHDNPGIVEINIKKEEK